MEEQKDEKITAEQFMAEHPELPDLFKGLGKTQENTSFVINETSRANSFETGKAGSRFKIYFDTAEDLKNQIDKLKDAGFDVNQDEKKEE